MQFLSHRKKIETEPMQWLICRKPIALELTFVCNRRKQILTASRHSGAKHYLRDFIHWNQKAKDCMVHLARRFGKQTERKASYSTLWCIVTWILPQVGIGLGFVDYYRPSLARLRKGRNSERLMQRINKTTKIFSKIANLEFTPNTFCNNFLNFICINHLSLTKFKTFL